MSHPTSTEASTIPARVNGRPHGERTRKPARKPTKVDVAFTLLLALVSVIFILAHDAAAEPIRVDRFGTAEVR